ncbi:hypothetical protein ABPG72_017112 [Tetrahymena utriculariae]
MWLIIIASLWTTYAVFIVRYLNRIIKKDYNFLTVSMPQFKEEYKPFERTERKQWNLLEIYICAIFLAPFRLLSIVFIISTLAMTCKLLGIKHMSQAQDELPRWKRFLIAKNLNFVGWGINFACGFMRVKTISKRIKDYEPEYPAEKYATEKKGQLAPILTCNHVSWVDIMAMSAVKEAPSFLSKEEIANYPLFGPAAIGIQSIFVQRDDRSQKNAVRDAILERGKKISEGQNLPPILIFPEGTTTNSHYLLSFKKGAFESFLPIKLYAINYKYTKFNPTQDYMNLVDHALIMCSQLYNTMEVYEFDTYFPDHLNLKNEEDWQIYAKHIRDIYLKVLPVKPSESGWRHMKEYYDQIKLFKKQLREESRQKSEKVDAIETKKEN